ncbi:MAG: efflux RND transporter periplasmic adaptor subunit [Thermodesulfobacteriota bacterium]|nr:efflux RND transporter periplasmic adaptor subunit [Thermodesulfobacteriota bacterium]
MKHKRPCFLFGRLLWQSMIAVMIISLSPPMGCWARDNASGKQPCTPASVTSVQVRDMKQTVKGVGSLRSEQKAVITAETAGTIERIYFEEGIHVEKDELLAQLESEIIKQKLLAAKAGVQETEAVLKNARRTYQRQARLYEQNLTSKDSRDKAETSLKTAMARLERLKAERAQARERLADTRIKAPFSGTIDERMVDEGNWIKVGTPITRLVKTDRLQIAFSLPERYMQLIQPGQEVVVMPAFATDKKITGKIFFVSPRIDEITRSFLVKAGIDNSTGELRPGGFASVAVTVEIHKNALVIPEEALIPTRQGYQVFVVQDGTAHMRKVTPGLRTPGLVEITQGLNKTDRIVRSGHIALHEGSRVCTAMDRKEPQ